jgi:hypothetical protein
MSSIDAYSATRNLIENTFSHLTWHETVCTQTGFKGISQIWKEEPAWYFWSNHVKGSFLLRLHAEEPIADNQYVSLTLHYFPRIDEGAYHGLSAGEKWLLSDESVFDQETNTPQYEAYEQFITLFVVAELGFVIDPDNQLQVLLYSSEKDANHPFNEFIDLLISSLNFLSKQHHQHAYSLQDGAMNTSFLSYSESAFHQFLDDFELDLEQLEDFVHSNKLAKWLHAAHVDAVCSMSGACSCSH